MRVRSIIFTLLLGLIAAPAHADVTYCMAPLNTCKATVGQSSQGYNNFRISCTTQSESTVYVAIASACATGGSDNVVTVRDNVTTYENDKVVFKTSEDLIFDLDKPANNKYCWCRIVAPAVSSQWVSAPQQLVGAFGNTPTEYYATNRANCINYCGVICTLLMGNSSANVAADASAEKQNYSKFFNMMTANMD